MAEKMNMIDQLDVPIPGASLTNDMKNNPMPYERPPQFVKKEEAVEFLFNKITNPKRMAELNELMREDVPVEDLTKAILFNGFAHGYFNPDLMLLLIEPVVFMLMFIASQANIEPVMKSNDRDLKKKGPPLPLQIDSGLMAKMKKKVDDNG